MCIRDRTHAGPGFGLRQHFQWVQHGGFGRIDARQQIIFVPKMIHQKPHGPQLHAIHRIAQMSVPVQTLQHETIAAQGHDDVGVLRGMGAVTLGQYRQRGLCVVGWAG